MYNQYDTISHYTTVSSKYLPELFYFNYYLIEEKKIKGWDQKLKKKNTHYLKYLR